MAATCKGGNTNRKKDKTPCIASHIPVEAEAETDEEANSSPFTLLHKYQSQVKRFNRGNIIISTSTATTAPCDHSRGQRLSPETIVRLSKLKLLHQTHQDSDDSLSHSHSYLQLHQNRKHINLISSLLEAAEKASQKHFDYAEKLLKKCLLMISSSDENPTERAVKFFAEALLERVDSQTGKVDLERKTFDLEECLLNYQHVILACEERLPSSQIAQFTAIQAILDTIGSAKTIHLIDFGIKTGSHWSIMMQGLSSLGHGRPQHLKITALGSSKDRLEETGKRLSSFADSFKLPFLFRSVVAEIKDDFDEQLLGCEGDDEAVVVYSGLHLWSKLANLEKIACFLKLVKKLNPCVMVVNEIEADTNSCILMDRLYGALPFTIATFDCLDTCLRGEAAWRNIVEEVFFRDMVQSITRAEGEEEGTTHRHAKIGFWREMFAEFDIVETELSSCCLDQARLMISGNEKWSPCTLEMDGKSMILGWKGTPLQSISAWKIDPSS